MFSGTFGQVDLPDGVTLPEPHRDHADEVGVHLLLRVLLPAHHQGRVPAGGHKVLVEQLVLAHCGREGRGAFQ